MKKFLKILLKVLLSLIVVPLAFVGGILYVVTAAALASVVCIVAVPFYLVYCCVADIWETY